MNRSATPLLVASIAVTLGTAPIVQAEDQPTPAPSQPASSQSAPIPVPIQPAPIEAPIQPEAIAPAWVIDLRSEIINQPRIGASIEPVSSPVSQPQNPEIEPATPQIQPTQIQPEPSPEAAKPEAAQPETSPSEISPEAPEPVAQPTQQQSPAPNPASPAEPQIELPLAQPLPEGSITPEFDSSIQAPNLAPEVNSSPIGQPTPIPSIQSPLAQPQFTQPPSVQAPSAPLDLASQAKTEALKTLDAPMIAVAQPLPDDWWHQGAQSPIAIAIGNAEGTRTPDGGKNQAYYWHQDPGNGADNFGTFSYQHLSDREQTPVDRQPSADQKRRQAASQGLPETADSRQLIKLQSFYQQLLAQAHLRGVALTELEILNGLDLANQSEEAALDSWGYVDRLIQAKGRTADPQDQINQARIWSYWNPKLNRWDAPGLGNHYEGIRHDQQRRSAAVTTALARQQGQALLAQSGLAQSSLTLNQPIVAHAPSPAEHQEAIDNLTAAILRFETERVN